MVRTYEVGKDLTPERYQEILEAITEWFRESRPKVEPRDAAEYTLQCCLRGVQVKDGVSPWTKLANSSLENRLRVAAKFDIITMQPMRTAEKPTEPEAAEGAEAADEDKPKLTREQRAALRSMTGDPTYQHSKTTTKDNAQYGDNPQVFFTPQELVRRHRLKEAYLADFPQLRSVASQAKLDMLLDLNLLMDRLRYRQGKSGTVRDTEALIGDITKQILALEKALNIHPDQLVKQQRDKEGGTIGEAVRRLEDSTPHELRERWFAEELLMLFQMYHQPSPRNNMGGYQLDEVGLFGATRCRTCACHKCGERNYAGLSIDEITVWLREKGLLREVVHKPDFKKRQEAQPDAEDPPMDEESEGDPADPAVG
jgi:hypothetical protein